MKEDRIFLGKIEDKIKGASEKYMLTYSDFLDPHEHSVASNYIRGKGRFDVEIVFFGGYEDAERVLMFCLPDYASLEDASKDALKVIRVKTKEGGRTLRHGDYLGSLTGLGVSRSKIGDILVNEGGADIIVSSEIVEFLMTNYAKAGRNYLSLSEHELSELELPENSRLTVKDTVASLRLDNIVSSAFGLSRAKAQEAIKRGIVFVNSLEQIKVDAQIEEGDKIVLRGKGKVLVKEIGNRTRKDRIFMEFERYV